MIYTYNNSLLPCWRLKPSWWSALNRWHFLCYYPQLLLETFNVKIIQLFLTDTNAIKNKNLLLSFKNLYFRWKRETYISVITGTDEQEAVLQNQLGPISFKLFHLNFCLKILWKMSCVELTCKYCIDESERKIQLSKWRRKIPAALISILRPHCLRPELELENSSAYFFTPWFFDIRISQLFDSWHSAWPFENKFWA